MGKNYLDIDHLAWNTKWQPLSGKQFQNMNAIPGTNIWQNTSNKGGLFSKANAGKTAKVAGAWQLGLNLLSSAFNKSKRGQPGVSNAPQLMASIQPNNDWMQFFKG